MQPQITFEEYKQAWLEKEEITSNLNTLEKGRRFAIKLLTEYYEIPEDEDNIFHIDGSGDGGIDIAYLAKADMYEEDLEIENGDIEVDELAFKIKRASELLQICSAKLKASEEEVEKILKDLQF